MVAQPVLGTRTTGCDTHPTSVAMFATAGDAASAPRAKGPLGKRVRVLEPEDPATAAAGPAQPAATLQELTGRVAYLERGRKNDLGWRKERGDIVNAHSKELEELEGEALQYNDNLHLV